MGTDLAKRISEYESAYDSSIIGRIPIIVYSNAKNFSKISKAVPKPFCNSVSEVFKNTMFETIKQIDTAILGYTKSDDIIFVLWAQNKDHDPWCANKVQKICSSISSMVTWSFQNFLYIQSPPNINQQIIFDTKAFAVPNVTEVINTLILQQHYCYTSALQEAVLAELGRKYDKNTAQKKIWGLKTQEKKDLLFTECGIDFEKDYPKQFRSGIVSYKAPKLMEINSKLNTRTKWIVDENTPNFVKDRMFLIQILSTGSDIFRADRDLIKTVNNS